MQYKIAAYSDNAFVKRSGALKMTDMKLQDMKMADKIAGHENARHEIARHLELCSLYVGFGMLNDKQCQPTQHQSRVGAGLSRSQCLAMT